MPTRPGIFNDVVEPDDLENYTLDVVARRILACSPNGIANAKFQLNLLARRHALTEEERGAIAAYRPAVARRAGLSDVARKSARVGQHKINTSQRKAGNRAIAVI